MTDSYSSLRETFFDECDALLGKALSLHATLSANANGAAFKELHRCVHGVAGGAASMDLPQLASLARALEAVLDPLRGGGTWPDPECRARCGEALQALVAAARLLRAGRSPDLQRMAMLESGLRSAVPPGANTQREEVRMIVFSVSRSLAGAEIVVEHVLDELAQAGHVESVSEDEVEPEARRGAWRLRFSGAVSDDWIRDLLGGVAEPGSLSVLPVTDGERPSADRRAMGAPVDASDCNDSHACGGEGEWFVGFRVATQCYACAAEQVLDVRPYRGEFVVPGLPAVVRGLIGVGEEAVPLLDGRQVLLGMRDTWEVPDAATMLVLQAPEGMVALLADEAGRSLRVEPGQLRAPTALQGLFAACPIVGMHFGAEGVSLVLDVTRLCNYLDPELKRAAPAREAPLPELLNEKGLEIAKKSLRSATIGPAGPPVPPAPRRGRSVPAGRRTLEEEWGRPDP